jgi:hemoglobin
VEPTPTMYEFAGGPSVFERLAEAQYRRCLEDPILCRVFGTVAHPEHAPRLAAWLAEVFGGPKTYSERYGGHDGMVEQHLNGAFSEEQRLRFVEVMMEAADEVGLPGEPRFRQRFRAYVEWGARIAQRFSQPGFVPPHGGDVPRWDWGKEGPPPSR